MSDGSKGRPKMTAGLDLGEGTPTSASSTQRTARWSRKVGYAPHRMLSGDASPPSSSAYSHRGRNPLAVG